MRLLLIEGIPGSGKTETAQHLWRVAQVAGIEAKWYLEEHAEHPVHPRSLRQRRHEPSFPDECLDAWRAFVTQSLSSPVLHILEGSAFQSTVRFMLESERSDIEQYYRQFENVTAPLSPALIYLRPADGFRFSRALAVHRGASWSQKVADYLSATQYGRRRGLEGVDGMYRFWQDYAEQCDALVTTSRLPNCIIDVAVGDEDRRLAEAVVYFRRMTLTANKAHQPFT